MMEMLYDIKLINADCVGNSFFTPCTPLSPTSQMRDTLELDQGDRKLVQNLYGHCSGRLVIPLCTEGLSYSVSYIRRDLEQITSKFTLLLFIK